MLRRTLAAVVLAVPLLGLLAGAPPVRASIAPPPPPHRLFAECDVVFLGTVDEVGDDAMTVRVTGEVLKGRPPEKVTVEPVHAPTCTPGRPEKPVFTKGNRVLVSAKLKKGGRYELHDHTLWSVLLHDDAHERKVVSLAREMLRIAALPTIEDRRAAMIALLLTRDAALVDAVVWFQFSELKEAGQSRPHAAALTAALDAPLAEARKVAARALRLVAAPEAWDRLVELSADGDKDIAEAATEAVALYDRDEAVAVIGRAAAVPGRTNLLRALASSPRPLAHDRLHEMLRGGTKLQQRVAFQALGHRAAERGATPRDVEALVGVVRRGGIADENPYDFARPIAATKSVDAARALIELVRDDDTGSVQRNVAYTVLQGFTTRDQMREVFDLVRKDEALFVRRLRAGGAQMHLLWLLGAIGTDTARDAVEWAEEEHPDEGARGNARRTLESWEYWRTGK